MVFASFRPGVAPFVQAGVSGGVTCWTEDDGGFKPQKPVSLRQHYLHGLYLRANLDVFGLLLRGVATGTGCS